MNGAERRELIQRELADLLDTDCEGLHEGACNATHEGHCSHGRAGEVLAFLQGAGLLVWGGWPTAEVPPDEAGLEFTGVRLSAEAWWRVPVDVTQPELAAYWRAVRVLGVRVGGGQSLTEGSGMPPRMRAAVLAAARELVAKLEEGADGDDGDGTPP